MSESESQVLNESVESESDYEPQFKPVITLPEVEVPLNEEDETIILKIRAKLYRFDSHGDVPEWKERGTGEMKLLRHNETSAMRLVMRRDKTLKVCANHFITPWMELKPKLDSEKAFVYTVMADFADEEPKSECLAIRFATVQNANLFKSKFEEAKKILLSECDLYNGKCDEENEFIIKKAVEEDESENSKDADNDSTDLTKKMKDLDVSKNDEIKED